MGMHQGAESGFWGIVEADPPLAGLQGIFPAFLLEQTFKQEVHLLVVSGQEAVPL